MIIFEFESGDAHMFNEKLNSDKQNSNNMQTPYAFYVIIILW